MLAMLVMAGLRPPAAGSSDNRCSSSDIPEPVDPDRLSTSPANAWISMSPAASRGPRPQIKDRVLVELTHCRACVHFTSLAKISSCGFVLICASSESSRTFVCLASVFCASGNTMILPLRMAQACPLRSRAIRGCRSAAGMVDRRVIVDQPPAVHEIQTVQCAVAAHRRVRR